VVISVGRYGFFVLSGRSFKAEEDRSGMYLGPFGWIRLELGLDVDEGSGAENGE